MLRKLQNDYISISELPFTYKFHDDSIGPTMYVSIQYQDQFYTIYLEFPPSYPFTPPRIQFLDGIYHPDVDADGNVCTSELVGWVNLRQILLHVYCLIDDANAISQIKIGLDDFNPMDKS